MSFVMGLATTTSGAVLFQSAGLGPIGITKDQVLNQMVPASNFASFYFVGTRFQLLEESIVTSIGGHFVGGFDEGSFFGAIIKLTDNIDFPDSGDLSTPDVLAVSNLRFPHPSADVFGQLSLKLHPGWYAVVFGTEAFGATGRGGVLRNGVDIGVPSYINWQPDNGWFESFPVLNGRRFVVGGYPIPEATSTALDIAVGCLLAALSRCWSGRAQ